MANSIRLTPAHRQALWEQYRKGANPRVRVRAPMLLLLTAGYSWAVIAGVLFCRTRTIARWQTGVETAGLGVVWGSSVPPGAGVGAWWSQGGAAWVTEGSPRDFGFLRSRWGCGVIVLLRVEIHPRCVSPETVRRGLQREQLGWRRPRPGVGPTDPPREAKLQALRPLLATLPATEIAVFPDEVDINLNPPNRGEGDTTRPAGRDPYARHQPEALLGRRAQLAPGRPNRPRGVPHTGAQRRAVRAPA